MHVVHARTDSIAGRTHAEVIGDWREAFTSWVRDKRLWTSPDRFIWVWLFWNDAPENGV
jgi:hypothetical protein